MRVMLLGAAGMLGHDLAATAPTDATLVQLSRSALDITDRQALAAKVTEVRPDLILNAAGYTAVDRAESEPDVAFKVNEEAVRYLGLIAAEQDIRVVHFSTDYVFDGTSRVPYKEDARTNPINVYGRSKLAGEVTLQKSTAASLVIRTQWLFGLHGRSFPATMLERLARRLPTRVVTDQTGRATYSLDLANATWRLIERDAVGLFHIANTGQASWYEIAEYIFRSQGRLELLARCMTVDYPSAAQRPLYTVLHCGKYESLTSHELPSWQDALRRYLVEAEVGPRVSS